MKSLKQYRNLYQLCQKSYHLFKTISLVSLGIFVLAFLTLFVSFVPFGLTMTMMLSIIPAIMFGIACLISGAKSKKSLKGFTPEQLTIIDAEIPNCPMCEGFCVTSQAVIGTGGWLSLIPMEKILWVYTYTTDITLHGLISVGKTTFLVFANRDQKPLTCKIKNKGNAFQFIQAELLKHRLDPVFGYERGMDDIYKKDLDCLIAFSQECAEMRKQEKMED